MYFFPKPDMRPANNCFSSGPCAKRPGWSLEVLKDASLGRSHRSKTGKAKMMQAIETTREILGVPDGYRIGIMPASDTGAMEAALWNLLGARGVDVVAWESFGAGWVDDVCNHLKLDDTRSICADYGKLPNLEQINFDHDVIFTWNGTTSGVKVPDGNFIPSSRKGLTICDATSAVFSQELSFDRLDVTTFSWQKALGGEAAHGMLILSPRAVDRLETYVPVWPLPKIFRLTKAGKLVEGIFEGVPINTPSMLCVEDYLDALAWVKSIGGTKAMTRRANANLKKISDYVARHDWLDFLAIDPETRSNTSVCLVISDPDIAGLSREEQARFAKSIVDLLANENVALDIGSYRDAPAGLRIWTGGTVELEDVAALMPWLGWAFKTQKERLKVYE